MNMDIKNEALSTNVAEQYPNLVDTSAAILPGSLPAPQAPAAQAVYEAKEIDIPAVQISDPQQGPKPGSPRWNEMYHKAKKADRLESELNQIKETVNLLKNNMGTVSISNITAELSNAQKQHKEALETGDYMKASQLNTSMMELINRKQSMENTFGSAVYQQPQQPQQQQYAIAENIGQQGPPIEAIVAAQTFEQNNVWYGQDIALQAAFNALHQQTIQDPNWDGKPISSQLNETLRQIKGKFPERFRQAAPPSAVAGVTPSAPQNVTPQVFLSQDEKKLAMMFSPVGTRPEVAEAEFLKNKMYYVQQGVKF